MLYVEINNQVQISFKGMQLPDKQKFLDTLKQQGYAHNITLDVFDVGLLVDTESKTILRVMSKTLDYRPGIDEVETIKAENFI
jgi:hypothetical protein